VFLVPPTPQPPFSQSDWPTPYSPTRSLIADVTLNRNVTLPPAVTGTPFPFGHVDALPAGPILRPHGVMHRPEFTQGATPFGVDLFDLAPRVPTITVDPIRNEILFPVVVPGVPFYKHLDWPTPTRPTLKPETFLFYYIQDQTSPAFIQFDWPQPARTLPVRQDDPIPNRLLTLLPFVPVTVPFYKHEDWPLPSRTLRPIEQDAYNASVFLKPPIGVPFSIDDWPRPQGARSLQPDHFNDRIQLLTVPVLVPFYKHLDWPNPARPIPTRYFDAGPRPLLNAAGLFKPEWAVNSNQILGPIAPTPETH
jgi:hypothetical protein